jgi:dTDP-4-amino-4,6-dideoxygalactose transaminase
MHGSRALDAFRDAICRRYGVPHAFFVSTGRAAFAIALQAMREVAPAGRDEVVVPAYTCYSVPASIARAGLKVRVCDVDPATLDYDRAALEDTDFSRVLCIASANLYGIPNDLPRIRALAERNGALVLDDAAQSMEARIGGEFSGTLGDIGFFSLDKGKNITTIDGGILVTRRADLARLLAERVARLPARSLATQLACAAKLVVYAGFLRPQLYWMPQSIPLLRLGTTPYPRDLPLEGYPAFLAGVGRRLFTRIAAITAARVQNANYALEQLAGVPGVVPIAIGTDASPVYLRLPLLVAGERRDAAVAALQRAGIGATASYPTAIPDIPGIDTALFRGPRHAPGGRHVARHILTLPTHPYVPRDALRRAAAILRDCTR